MSSGSIRIIQLPEKSSVNTDDYMAVDSSANGTKKVKFTDLLDSNLSAQNKAADASATGQAISELNTNINNANARIDNLITDGEPSIKTLWTGTLQNYNQEVTLSESISNFDYIDVYISQLDFQYIRRPVSSTIGIEIQSTNLLDDGDPSLVQFWEGHLNISGTTAKITKANNVNLHGGATYTPPTATTNDSIPTITRIDGVKNSSVALSEEVSDIRIGDDGVTYQTAGEAVRTQFADVKSDISDIKDIVYKFESASISATATGWRLNESDGLCSSASGYKLDKYAVTAGQKLKINSDDRFQFQNSQSVPSTAPNNRVGGITYGIGEYLLTVPENATYLIVSTVSTNSTASVSIATPISATIDDIASDSEYGDTYNNRGINQNSNDIESILDGSGNIECDIDEYLYSGSLVAGTPTASNYNVHTGFIDNSATSNPTFYYDSSTYSINIHRFDSNKSYVGQTGWLTLQPIRIRSYLTDPFIRIEIKRIDGALMDRENVRLYTKRIIANNIAYSSDLNSAENRLLNVASANAKANAKSISDILDGNNVLEEYYPLMERVDYAAGSFIPATNTLTSEAMVHHNGEKYYYDNTNYKANICFSSDGITYSATGFVALPSPFKLETYGISASYVRIGIRRMSEATIDYVTEGDLRSSYTAQNNISYASTNSHSISNGDSLLEGVQYCYANGKGKLIVEAGTYDIISEYETKYGASYFSNYADNYNGMVNGKFDCGIWLEDIEVVFSSGAKVVAIYEGNNDYVKTFFSAFACGNNVTIDGLVLDASELRYGIHPDFNSGDVLTTFIVRNSDLHHYKPSSQGNNNQCLGCGLGKHVRWIFENNIFRSDGQNIVVRIHNNVNSDAQSQIIMKNCYFDGEGYARFNAYSTSTLQTMIEVCGCSWETAPVVGKETAASNENFTMIAWNNELRS